MALRPTRHKIGHLGDVSAIYWLGMEKTNRTPIKKSVVKHKQKKLKPGLVAFYDVWLENAAGLFSKEKIREEISK